MDRFEVKDNGVYRGAYQRCLQHGIWMTLGFIQRSPGGARLAVETENAPTLEVSKEIRCPNCRADMRPIAWPGTHSVLVDRCSKCRSIWLDLGDVGNLRTSAHFETMVPASSTSPPPIVPGRAAAEETITMPSEAEKGIMDEGYYHPLHMLGLPTEEEVARKKDIPAMTIVLILFWFAMSIAYFKSPIHWIKWAFMPTDPFANRGLNWITSLFLHGGWIHLLSISYFFWICGDDIEEEIGSLHLFGLLIVGGAAGHLATMKLGSTLPSFGASAGVTAALTYYAFAFPKHRMHLTRFFRYYKPTWESPFLSQASISYSLSAGFFVIFFLLKELMVVGLQYSKHPTAYIPYIANFAGLFVGVIFYLGFPRAKRST